MKYPTKVASPFQRADDIYDLNCFNLPLDSITSICASSAQTDRLAYAPGKHLLWIGEDQGYLNENLKSRGKGTYCISNLQDKM